MLRRKTACHRCYLAKTRCTYIDNGKICERCERLGLLDCVPRTPSRIGRPPQSKRTTRKIRTKLPRFNTSEIQQIIQFARETQAEICTRTSGRFLKHSIPRNWLIIAIRQLCRDTLPNITENVSGFNVIFNAYSQILYANLADPVLMHWIHDRSACTVSHLSNSLPVSFLEVTCATNKFLLDFNNNFLELVQYSAAEVREVAESCNGALPPTWMYSFIFEEDWPDLMRMDLCAVCGKCIMWTKLLRIVTRHGYFRLCLISARYNVQKEASRLVMCFIPLDPTSATDTESLNKLSRELSWFLTEIDQNISLPVADSPQPNNCISASNNHLYVSPYSSATEIPAPSQHHMCLHPPMQLAAYSGPTNDVHPCLNTSVLSHGCPSSTTSHSIVPIPHLAPILKFYNTCSHWNGCKYDASFHTNPYDSATNLCIHTQNAQQINLIEPTSPSTPIEPTSPSTPIEPTIRFTAGSIQEFASESSIEHVSAASVLASLGE